MADINGVTLSAGSSPTVYYAITYSGSRPNNSQMTYDFTIECSLSSSSSYIGNGMALMCTITVNGSSSSVRIKANDNDYWSGNTRRYRYVSVTCTSTVGNELQGVRFQVVSDGRISITSGVINNSSYTVTSAPLLISACGAPTYCSVSPTLAEGNATLSWSGASAGISNDITSYEIQYSDSSNNLDWGAWAALTTLSTSATGGSAIVSPPSARGYYRRFQVRTRGSAGASYYSGWRISSNSVCRNTVPNAPTSATATPTIYSNETITLSWSGASGGTSPIQGYQIASRTSTDAANWSGWDVLASIQLSASGGSYNPVVTRTPSVYTQFAVWTIDTLNVYSTERISNSIYCNVTACGAPTAFSLSATVAEANATLSWSGASGGAGNAIVSYEIQYSDSTNGSSWGAWLPMASVNSSATSGTLSVSPPGTRGDYRRFQIRTRGEAGASYYSPWKLSSNTVRKNILPSPPTTFTAAPAIYESGNVLLNWNGTVAGTSAIRQYVIQQQISTDNVNWSAWETVTTVNSSALSGAQVVTPSNVPGTSTRYRISVTDILNAVSGYAISNTVRKNASPLAPLVEAPSANGITYNRKPRCFIQTQAEPDGNPQTIYVLTPLGTWENSVDNPEDFTTSGAMPNSIRTIFTCPVTPLGAASVSIQCRDPYSAGAMVTRSFTIAESPFEEIVANETHVKAAQIETLRTAVNNVRSYFTIPAYVWSVPLQQGVTNTAYWPYHVIELRAAVQGVIDKINLYDGTELDGSPRIEPIDWLPLGHGRPRADVMNQLRNVVLML